MQSLGLVVPKNVVLFVEILGSMVILNVVITVQQEVLFLSLSNSKNKNSMTGTIYHSICYEISKYTIFISLWCIHSSLCHHY